MQIIYCSRDKLSSKRETYQVVEVVEVFGHFFFGSFSLKIIACFHIRLVSMATAGTVARAVPVQKTKLFNFQKHKAITLHFTEHLVVGLFKTALL